MKIQIPRRSLTLLIGLAASPALMPAVVGFITITNTSKKNWVFIPDTAKGTNPTSRMVSLHHHSWVREKESFPNLTDAIKLAPNATEGTYLIGYTADPNGKKSAAKFRSDSNGRLDPLYGSCTLTLDDKQPGSDGWGKYQFGLGPDAKNYANFEVKFRSRPNAKGPLGQGDLEISISRKSDKTFTIQNDDGWFDADKNLDFGHAGLITILTDGLDGADSKGGNAARPGVETKTTASGKP
jgi:hypothetical protein